ncbi:hypothetical protein A2230_00035 [candidate division WOR-1 bacterium RIFOXYA2_FULL_36_21]|uniref:PorV/PorQ family protein n=1 Tax=candidate division WOR-1 bacterium RIFOXYB2_FULL_36_35 TaxID=1802578 RepID=A0A1F4S0A5_UNCSA|nr:MAG: hypothetical protein A2230_00035 [candidate division WOR-1 bacterium RIFOXYA2_FULL_36_21]OGC13173.1 MAG: hypothetical protein A2290_01435 [candidate division WOR-1 bacterium RIFOXYB2_FULL_36_35]OGC18635.1 MAG: hypothetical protein A2282_05325 [candidate division WOR-1 bacterium RIFOXYA12_FULL_36_13]
MNKIGRYDLLITGIIFILTVMVGVVYGATAIDPTEIGVGARSLGMGKAYTAIADDGSAMFTNPAGLSKSSGFQIVSMNGNLLTEVPYTLVGLSQNMLEGTVAVGYVGLGMSGIQETVLVNGTPEATGNEASFGNSVFNISYSTDIEKVDIFNRINTGIFRDIKMGASVKFINQGYSGGGTSFSSGNKSGLDVDLGLISKIGKNETVGLAIKNILPGNNIGAEELPMSITAGFSNKFEKLNLLLAVDLEVRDSYLFHVGCEWKPIEFISLRGGIDQSPSGGEVVTNTATGVGINIKGFTFDYAYHTYAELVEFSTHYFSIGYSGI